MFLQAADSFIGSLCAKELLQAATQGLLKHRAGSALLVSAGLPLRLSHALLRSDEKQPAR